MLDRADGGRVGNLMVKDELCLLLCALCLCQLFERKHRAVLRRLFIEQNGLSARTGLDAQARIKMLQIIASTHRCPVKLANIVLTSLQVVGDGALERAGSL